MESYSTVSEAVDALKARGFTSNFEFIKGRFTSMENNRHFDAAELVIVEHHRFEGITNPADESIVYAIESSDGVRGTLVDAYGVYANPELSSFLENVKTKG